MLRGVLALIGIGRVRRSAEAQAQVDGQCRSLTLYHFPTCPFCWRVRLNLRRLGLTLPMVNVMAEPDGQIELMTRGGKLQVPCLWIKTPEGSHWLYESEAIIDYLERRFGESRFDDEK